MKSTRKVAFHTLGCKLNYSETSTIGRMFEQNGYTKVDFSEEADIYVINTCSVTENADRECRQVVRTALNTSPEAFVAVIGCYAQLKPDEIARIEGVDLVLGATEKFKLLNYVEDLNKRTKTDIYSCEIEDASIFTESWSYGDRTRAFLKVQDGCDYNCAFCTIPLARGASRSGSIAGAMKNAREIAQLGVKEIVLTGVNIGDFGSHGETFLQLIQELDTIEGIERFRISSIEPNLLKDEIIEFVAKSKRFVPHFHIPLQSGSNKTLKAMRRRYAREVYASRVAKIRELMPHCCIGVDVITGFPGETHEDFMECYDFIHSLDISYLHVFTYSERDNTEAASMKDKVPMAERKKRTRMLRILSSKKLRHFYEQHLGGTRKVLFEEENREGFMFGYSDNYIKVKAPYDVSKVNRITEAIIGSIGDDGITLTKEGLLAEEVS